MKRLKSNKSLRIFYFVIFQDMIIQMNKIFYIVHAQQMSNIECIKID